MGALSGLSKAEVSSKLAEDTRLFMENGGTITYVEYDDRKEKVYGGKPWIPMGASLFDELDLDEGADVDDMMGFNDPYSGIYGGLNDLDADEPWRFEYGSDESRAAFDAMRDASDMFGDSSLDNDEDF